MNKSKLLVLGLLLSATAALPALADYNRIGSVDVGGGRRGGRDTQDFSLGGPVERLELRASGSDVDCRSVDASFANGRTRTVFQGQLAERRTVDVDLPGNDRSITRLSFNCRSQDRRGASIDIMADVGRYQSDWRKGPDFQRTWAKVFNWGSNAINDWKPIGSERFEGRGDSETVYADFNGRAIDAVALMPVEADARCSQVVADFHMGPNRKLAVNNGDTLRRGQYYKLDLPGDRRDLNKLHLSCHAQGARAVTIRIYSSK